MADRFQQLVGSGPGRMVLDRAGVPQPAKLRRYTPGQPLLEGAALVGGAGRLGEIVASVLGTTAPQDADDLGAVIFDASAVSGADQLGELRDFFGPAIPRLRASGRLLVLGTPPELAGDARAHTAQRALEGFVKSAGKELRHGSTAQLVYVAPGAEANAVSALRFLLSARSAYVSGQVVRVGPGESREPEDWDRAHAGRVALVTGAARGIGAAIVEVLARDGADVICLDVPAAGEDLVGVANKIGGSALQLDITADGAGAAITDHVRDRHGGVDVVVHNAGITRDRTLARMSEEQWEAVLAVNLLSQEAINDALLGAGALRRLGRIVTVSSVSGIAGNRGQANYATSKAGVIGMVEALAPALAEHGATINAVAPGFIETKMTEAMPLLTREVGRRMNSLAQGGLPVDVAETIGWLASPASGGVNGNTIRVCGQSMLGA